MAEKISLAIPVHDVEKRLPYLQATYNYAVNEPRISEIVFSCEPGQLPVNLAYQLNSSKAVTFENKTNQGPFRNKFLAIQRCTSEWVIILDSDNGINESYLDRLCAFAWRKETVYQPEALLPTFNLREFSGQAFNKTNVAKYMNIGMFRTMLNAMNYFVNRDTFIASNEKAFELGFDPVCADSLFINYNLLKNGCSIYVVPGLHYQHLVHNGSYFKQTSQEFGYLVPAVEDMIRRL